MNYMIQSNKFNKENIFWSVLTFKEHIFHKETSQTTLIFYGALKRKNVVKVPAIMFYIMWLFNAKEDTHYDV